MNLSFHLFRRTLLVRGTFRKKIGVVLHVRQYETRQVYGRMVVPSAE
jgi:hypothetical protein